MARLLRMDYSAPAAYDRMIAKRYRPIAESLVEAAHLQSGEHVLEIGAGTGLVTKLAAKQVQPHGRLCATDLSRGMLSLARKHVREPGVSFVVADYTEPFPFLDESFDVVLSGLTFVQSTTEPLAEAVRVLKPAGRLALVMWGPYYGEVRMAAAARRTLGQPPLPSAAPGRAVARLERVGLHRIERQDLKLTPRFRTVDDYLTYRRAFGIPLGQTRAAHNRYLEALHREAARHIAPDGSLTIDWTLSVITAEKPRRTRRNPRRVRAGAVYSGNE